MTRLLIMMGSEPPNGEFVTWYSDPAGVVASPAVTDVAGISPIPHNSGAVLEKVTKATSSITPSQQTRSTPEYGDTTLEGRNGKPPTTTLEVRAMTFTATIELAGSRWETSSESCAASAQVRKNGAVRPVTIVVCAAVLSWIWVMRPRSG